MRTAPDSLAIEPFLKDSVDRCLKAEVRASLLESGKSGAGWAHCAAGLVRLLELGRGRTGIADGAKKYAPTANGSRIAAAACLAVGREARRVGSSWVGSDFSCMFSAYFCLCDREESKREEES